MPPSGAKSPPGNAPEGWLAGLDEPGCWLDEGPINTVGDSVAASSVAT